MSAPVLPPFDDVVRDRGARHAPEQEEPARPWGGSSRRERQARRAQAPARVQARWTGGSALATRASTALVAVALLSGPAALGLMASSSAQPAAPAMASTDPQALVPDAVVAGQRAQQWVRAWLTTSSEQEEDLAGLWDGRVQLPDVASQVGQTTVADLRALGQGRWAVTVAAVVTDPAASPDDLAGAGAGGTVTDDGEQAAADPAGAPGPTTRFFQVPVTVERSKDQTPQATVLALPAAVPAPTSGAVPGLSYADSVGSDSPVAQVVTSFLTALVTGQGDLAPYLSPGTSMTAIDPPAADGLIVRRIGPAAADRAVLDQEVPLDGAQLRVLADVELVDADAQPRASTYPLTLTARDGRWEITSLDVLPVLSTPPPAATASADVPPSSPPASTPTAAATASS